MWRDAMMREARETHERHREVLIRAGYVLEGDEIREYPVEVRRAR